MRRISILWRLASAIVAGPLVAGGALAVEAAQVDNFEDGSTLGWSVGNPANHPAPPTQQPDCGEDGDGDSCLVLTSTGNSGPGGRLTAFNSAQWAGDYIAANIGGLTFQAANMGTEDVYLRIRVESSTGDPLISLDSVLLPADGMYRTGTIRLTANALNSFDQSGIAETMSSVSNFRLFHNENPSFQGPLEAHTIYIDDITAVPVDFIFASAFDLSAELNDSGLLVCADDTVSNLPCPVAGFPGQDAESGRDVTSADNSDGKAGFSFTKLNGAGNRLPANATSWACVLDNVTGLMWEGKTDDNSFRDGDAVLNWYNPDPTTNGGDAGDEGFSCDVATEICNIDQYVVEMNTIQLCGFADWRAPTVSDLLGLIDYGAPQDPPQAMIDLDYFPNARRGGHWSIVTSAGDSSGAGAFMVSFRDGTTSNISKQIAGAAFRAVRGKGL